jgi:hypothetical protein
MSAAYERRRERAQLTEQLPPLYHAIIAEIALMMASGVDRNAPLLAALVEVAVVYERTAQECSRSGSTGSPDTAVGPAEM